MSMSMSMSTLPSSTFANSNLSLSTSLSSQKLPLFHTLQAKSLPLPFPHLRIQTPPPYLPPPLCKSPEGAEAEAAPPEEDEWLQKLPEKSKPLYSHSLPCIEAWLRSLGFCQSKEDRALWVVHKPDWHAQLSLDVTDLYIRYLSFLLASVLYLLFEYFFLRLSDCDVAFMFRVSPEIFFALGLTTKFKTLVYVIPLMPIEVEKNNIPYYHPLCI